VEKTPIYIFSTFGSKINQFDRKKLEKLEASHKGPFTNYVFKRRGVGGQKIDFL
jgi:hypothetical protein